MTDSDMRNLTHLKSLTYLPDLWWRHIPIGTRRVSRTLSITLADGLYLSAWPKIAAFAPPLTLLTGFFLGWSHFAPGNMLPSPFLRVETFTYSLIIMALMLIIGTLSSGLGAWLVLGYAIGDFFLFNHFEYYRDTFHNVIFRVGVPLLLSYILLATLLICIPLISKRVSQATLLRRKAPHATRILAVAGLHAGIQAALVFAWTQTVPILIRPVYTWHRENPADAAIQPLQRYGWILVLVSIVVSAPRVVIEHRASMKPEVTQRAGLVQNAWIAAHPTRRWNLPPWGVALLRAGFTTFLLSGMLTTWGDAVVLVFVVVLILLTRQVLPGRFGPWYLRVSHIPILIRMAVGALISALLVWLILSIAWKSISNQGVLVGIVTFRPVLISVIASIIVFSLLFPYQTTVSEKKRL